MSKKRDNFETCPNCLGAKVLQERISENELIFPPCSTCKGKGVVPKKRIRK